MCHSATGMARGLATDKINKGFTNVTYGKLQAYTPPFLPSLKLAGNLKQDGDFNGITLF